MNKIILKPNREKSLLRRHPWVFSGAVAKVEGSPQPGGTIDICTSSGSFLAQAAYSPESQIRARVWTFDEAEKVDEAYFLRRLEAAVEMRRLLKDTGWIDSNAVRLVHGESDGLPGLVIDQYGKVLVLQALSAGAETWKDTIAEQVMELTGAESLYERSDVDVRRLEGLPEKKGLLKGVEPPDRIEIREADLKFWVDVRGGHKTGYYLDQRANRALVKSMVRGRDVLDCFSYTGGFTIASALGGANSVLSIDSSGEAIQLAKQNLQLNPVDPGKVYWIEADVFQTLRTFRDSRKSFDLIVLDPPKFAQTASQAERAARGYKDINLLAFKLLRPGGLLFTFSCSGGINEDLFQQIVAGAALDAGVDAQIIRRMHQGPDHPISVHFPEGAYLKGLVCRKE
ncbi:MAG: methyltransferase domain-containing protein [Chloroflexi bacterium]|nr:MAG: methyltransferase domain-containing protein [Chloroflexota bacterium]